jgi:hypothetical protein
VAFIGSKIRDAKVMKIYLQSFALPLLGQISDPFLVKLLLSLFSSAGEVSPTPDEKSDSDSLTDPV